jgi:hypothetical protein
MSSTEVFDFLSLPKLVQEMVLQDFTISSAFEVPILAIVCKRFHALLFLDASSTPMWKRLVLNRWVFVRTRSAVTDWQAFYRHRSIKQNMDESDLTVENCGLESQFEWKLNCPVVLSKISRTHDTKVDYCSQCKENVYICSSIEELTAHVDQKHCVAFDSDGAVLSSRVFRPRFMGMMVRRR